MATATLQQSVDEVISKYNNLNIGSTSSNPTIEVELKNVNGYKDGFADDFPHELPVQSPPRRDSISTGSTLLRATQSVLSS